jgi:flagellar biosynthesis chaperone FliJ
MNELKREKAARIRKLKNDVKEHDTQIQELNKYYQDIITNLAIVI